MSRKEVLAEYKREWARQNRDPVADALRQKEWRQKNPARARAIKRRHRDKDPAATKAKGRAAAREYRRKNPEKVRDNALRSKYGIGVTERAELEAAQGGLCAICQSKPGMGKKLFVDHNHSSGKVRGLLCAHCNTVIGYARESTAILYATAAYLRGHEKEDEKC